MRVLPMVAAFLAAAISAPAAFATCLDEAATFSERICGELSNRGSSELVTGSGELSAEAKGLVARMLGSAQGSANVSEAVATYENVAREELAKDHANVRDCKMRMVDVAVKQVCKQGADNSGSSEVAAPATGVASGPMSDATQITEQESKRRQKILDQLGQEYIRTDGRCLTVGDPSSANRWANKRLLEMGENWQLPIGSVANAHVSENYIYGGCNRIDVQAGEAHVNNNHLFGEDNSIKVDATGKAQVDGNNMAPQPMLPH